MEPKDSDEAGGEVVSLDEARKKAEEAKADGGDAAVEGQPTTVTVNGAEFLRPVMAAIARELANVADPDGTVRVGGSDEASRAKTAAVVKGLGMGLGQALAEAFGKWAQKIETGQVQGPLAGTFQTTPAAPEPPEDPDKKPS
jgi:hypothetical protein